MTTTAVAEIWPLWTVMALSSDPSAWRNFRKPTVATRPVGRPWKHPELNMFYGYPAELIAEWCCVAFSTAFARKFGRLEPSKPAAKPFRLHRERLVLSPEWRGWVGTRNAIIDPEGNETPRDLLRSYSLMLQYCRELAARVGPTRRTRGAGGCARRLSGHE